MKLTLELIQHWMKERENVRKGLGTDDPIIKNSRFCNVNREDDKVSKWIFENCTSIEQVLLARLVNRIDVLEEMRASQWTISSLLEREGALTNSKAYQFYPRKGETIRTILKNIYNLRSVLSAFIQRNAQTMSINKLSLSCSAILGRPLHFYFMMVILDIGHMGLADIDMNSEPYEGPGGKRTLKDLGMTLEEVAKALDVKLYAAENLCCEARKYVERLENGIPNNRKYKS